MTDLVTGWKPGELDQTRLLERREILTRFRRKIQATLSKELAELEREIRDTQDELEAAGEATAKRARLFDAAELASRTLRTELLEDVVRLTLYVKNRSTSVSARQLATRILTELDRVLR